MPIFQATSFVFENTADAADLFALQKYGNVYTGMSNPTVAAFEERMASLEGGIGAVAAASAVQPNTKLVYTEVVANPSGVVADLEGLAAVAHDAGIPPDLIRISVGIEDADDITWDIEQALHTATGAGG